MIQYKEFAYIYDELMHGDVDYDAWLCYIEKLFELHGVNPGSICELACGTGSMTSRLEERGYDVTGVDISRDMLRAAEKKLHRSRLVASDMSRFREDRIYDAFLCMIDGINYITVPKALVRTFKNVRAQLADGGVFIFDISSRYKLKNILGSETYIHSEYDVFYSWQNAYYQKYNLCDMLLNFFVRNKNDESYRRFEERHLQRGWSISQLKKMLEDSGFSEISVYDELTTCAPVRESMRLVFVCK